MTVGEFIQWMDPENVASHMSKLNDIWYELACFNQKNIAEYFGISYDLLHQAFAEYDKEQKEGKA